MHIQRPHTDLQRYAHTGYTHLHTGPHANRAHVCTTTHTYCTHTLISMRTRTRMPHAHRREDTITERRLCETFVR